MNNLIQKLAEQAIEDMPGSWNIPDEFCKNFAELIVRECALTAGLMEQEGRKNIGAQILDNFGVKE
jgi:hypothetical protein